MSAVNYRDEDGGWIARLGPEGEFRGGILVEPSPKFEAERNIPPPPRPPDPDQEAIDAFAAGDDTKQVEALRAITKRMMST